MFRAIADFITEKNHVKSAPTVRIQMVSNFLICLPETFPWSMPQFFLRNKSIRRRKTAFYSG